MLRLWNRLVILPENRLTKHVFINDYYLAMSNFDNWCKQIWSILNSVGEDLFFTRSICNIVDISKKLLKKTRK